MQKIDFSNNIYLFPNNSSSKK